MLALLDIEGATITTDAMGCQFKIAEQIVKAKGDYVLALKGSQGECFDDVQCFLNAQVDKGFEHVLHSYLTITYTLLQFFLMKALLYKEDPMRYEILSKALKYVCIMFTIILVLFAAWLSQSNVKLTSGQVYDSLYLPVFGNYARVHVRYSAFSGTPTLKNPSMQGPIVFEGQTHKSAKWFCKDKVYTQIIKANNLEITCSGETHHIITNFIPSTTKKYNFNLPEKLVFVSDLHGDSDYFNEWAKTLGVIDSNQNWSFGNGHVVILGDSVDNGRNTFELLWTIVNLAQQAETYGGKLHYIHGNHEQYILTNNFSRVEAEQLFAMKQLADFTDAFSPNTLIGKWLREQPVILKIGPFVLTHAGISETVFETGLSINEINQGFSNYLNSTNDDAINDTLFGLQGITRYRGYVRGSDTDKKADKSDIDKVLAHFEGRYLIAGHTKVDSIQPSYDGRVYMIDNAAGDTLFIENGQITVRKLNIKKVDFKDNESITRPFNLTSLDDWLMIYHFVVNSIRLMYWAI